MGGMMNLPQVESEVLRELHRPRHRHWPRMLAFAVMYAAAAGGAYYFAKHKSIGGWIYLALAPLYLLAAASLHGISLFTHEAVHGTLMRNRQANGLLGAVCAWPVLQNFSAYRVLHLRHHNHLGEEGDPDHYDNYTRWSWLVFAMHWGRLIAGYPAYITMIPILGLRHGKGWEKVWIILEVMCVAAMVAGAMWLPIPRGLLLHGWLVPMLFINTLVNIRGMSQHTLLEEASDTIRGTRSILTNQVTAFFMCNENYHLEHHLYPGVPWYNLPRLHQVMKEELAARGAPYIGSYYAFVWSFVTGSLKRSPLGKRASG